MPQPERPRGIKRRWSSNDDDDARLQRILHHNIRELHQVAKKAKTFEIQRVFKKLKNTRKDDIRGNEKNDLEEEMRILKHVDCNNIANTALNFKIRKDKLLSNNSTVQSVVSAKLASNSFAAPLAGTPAAKAQSRLLSSKLLASQVSTIIDALKESLHPSRSKIEVRHFKESTGVPKTKVMKTEDNWTGISVTSDDYQEGGLDSDEDEHDDGWESGTIADTERLATNESETGSVHDSVDSGGSDVLSDPDCQSSVPRNSEIKPKKLFPQDHSTFLPTLSVGFTRGDSDSEFCDNEAAMLDKVKKNRRGQRARRAIWEKKFGKNAVHLKKQNEVARGKKSQSSATKKQSLLERQHNSHLGEQPAREFKSGAQKRNISERTLRTGVSSNSGPRQTKNDQQAQRPLHPSWEAKKKQRTASIVPSQGTKIVF